MAKKLTGGGILSAMKSGNFDGQENINIPTFVEEKDGSLVNPTNKLAEIGLNNAKSPTEAQDVVEAVNIFDQTKEDAYKTVNKQNQIIENTSNALLKVLKNSTPLDQRQPEFNAEDIDMGVYNTLSQYPPSERAKIIAEFNNSAKANKRNVVEPAIEALGVQQYFPSLGSDNIRVGGYSGKVIGNVDIFVPRGGQLPFGYRDARKRAMEKQAQEKAIQAEKIKQLHYDTADQYQAQFDDLYMRTMDTYLKSTNYDYNELANGRSQLSREFIKTNQKFENTAKEILYVDAINKKVLEDLQSGKEVPQGVIEAIAEWKEGQLNLEEFIKDGGKFPQLAEKLKSYANIIEITDKMADQMKETGQTILPLNMNTMTPDEVLKANEAFKLKKGQDYDTFMSGVAKYFDLGQAKSQIDTAWEKNSNLYRGDGSSEDAQRQKAIFAENFMSKLGKTVELKQDVQANKNFERSKLYWDNYWKKKESEQFYTELNNTATKEVWTSINDRIKLREEQIANGTAKRKDGTIIPKNYKLTASDKAYMMNEEFRNYGLEPMVDANGNNILNFSAFRIPKTSSTENPNYTMSSNSKSLRIDVLRNKNGNWVKSTATPDEIAGNSSMFKLPNGNNIPDQTIKEAKFIRQQGIVNLFAENQYGWMAKKNLNTGTFDPAEFSSGTGEAHNMVSTQGSVNIPVYEEVTENNKKVMKQKFDEEGKPIYAKSKTKWTSTLDNSSDENQAILGEGQKVKTQQIEKVINQ